MVVENQPKLRFYGVDFVDIKLITKSQYDLKANIDVNITPKVFNPKDNPLHFKIIMEVNLICERFFELRVVGLGNFELTNEVTDVVKKNFINLNAPAIMFPYVRSFISTLSANLGNVTGHIMIPTQFFQGELESINAAGEKTVD